MTSDNVASAGRDERPPGALDRLLRVFGDVRAGEGATALLMSLNVFLLLTGCWPAVPS